MKAKTYLQQAAKSKRMIKFYQDRIEELEHEAAGIRAITYDGDKVQVTLTDTMPDMIARILETKKRYAEAVVNHHEIVQRITEQVNAIDNPLYSQVLSLRYLEFDERTGRTKTLREIALIMHKQDDRMRHIHGEALEAFRRKYLISRQ